MKKRNITLAIVCSAAIVACGQGGREYATANSEVNRSEAQVATEPMSQATKLTFKIKGKINHDKWDKSQTAEVEFSRIPQSIEEFKELQQSLGKEPQGAVALQIMAFEMFHRDSQMGSQALDLNNTQINANGTKRQLKEVLREDDSYGRPYLAAALLVGATPENAYSPSKPYKVSLRVDPVTKYQYSSDYDGNVIYLQVDGKGWDTNWRGVQVVKPADSEYYLIFNCPALYTQCKKIRGEWQGLD